MSHYLRRTHQRGHNENYSCSETLATLGQARVRMLRPGLLSAIVQQNRTANHAIAKEIPENCTWQYQVCVHNYAIVQSLSLYITAAFVYPFI